MDAKVNTPTQHHTPPPKKKKTIVKVQELLAWHPFCYNTKDTSAWLVWKNYSFMHIYEVIFSLCSCILVPIFSANRSSFTTQNLHLVNYFSQTLINPQTMWWSVVVSHTVLVVAECHWLETFCFYLILTGRAWSWRHWRNCGCKGLCRRSWCTLGMGIVCCTGLTFKRCIIIVMHVSN